MGVVAHAFNPGTLLKQEDQRFKKILSQDKMKSKQKWTQQWGYGSSIESLEHMRPRIQMVKTQKN